MSSILTNNAAMTALQTLRGINQNLAKTQDEISTGKSVATAKDNAAFFAISSVMDSDVKGFKAISDSLSLGDATLAVARTGAETVTDLLNELKGRVVAAQEDNVDRAKIQADVAELRNQIVATVDASQFNGLNMLQGVPGNPSIDILGSLNRTGTTTVTTSAITVPRTTLESGATVSAVVTSAAATGTGGPQIVADFGATGDPASGAFVEGDVIALKLANSNGQGLTLRYEVTAADIAAGQTVDNVATAAATAFNTQLTAANAASDFDSTGFTIAASAQTITLDIANTQLAAVDYQSSFDGGLAELALMDVSTEGGAKAALDSLEAMIQTSVDSAAVFGSAQKRIEIQSNFVSKISDELKSGIGALVDADLEAASARLQALQVQQQLGTQALSIANQQPQSILALFRN